MLSDYPIFLFVILREVARPVSFVRDQAQNATIHLLPATSIAQPSSMYTMVIFSILLKYPDSVSIVCGVVSAHEHKHITMAAAHWAA